MTVRINKSFSPPLPVNSGCPQGSLLRVLIFNVSSDDVELSPEGILDSTESDSIHVGEFFNSVDREFLRDQESNDSELLPSIVMDSLDEDLEPLPFEENGSPSTSFFNNTSTPLRSSAGDEFVLNSPDLSPVRLSDQSENVHEYFSEARRRPRRIVYSDSSVDLLRPELPVRWLNRPLKCFKYIDDCLTVEKVYMKRAETFNVDGRITALSKAPKTQKHFRTVEYNAGRRGMQINNE